MAVHFFRLNVRLLCFIFVVSSPTPGAIAHAFASQTYVVYGSDDRYESYEIDDPKVQLLSRATVALMAPWHLTQQDEAQFSIKAETVERAYALCPTQKFADQPSASYCTGVLIGEDRVLTAGHCMRWSSVTCWGVYLVFDYKIELPGEIPTHVLAQNVYRCSEVVERSASADLDYAIIRLDRKVTDRKPVPVLPELSVKKGESVFAIGHPLGLPQKIAWYGKVREVYKDHLVTNLDMFVNNSGSPVFRKKDGLLVGILKDGEDDLVYNESNRCQVVKQCEENGCLGEQIQRF